MSDQSKATEADFVMPVVEYQDEQAALEKPRRPRRLAGKRIALLPNFRVISPAFMQALADTLQSRTDVARAYFKKTPEWPFNHAQRMSEIASEIDEAARGCDLMICGVGD